MPTTNSGYGIGQRRVLLKSPSINLTLGKPRLKLKRVFLKRCHKFQTCNRIQHGENEDRLACQRLYLQGITDRFVVVFEGHFKRNYIHIRDVARAFIHGIDNFDKMKNEAYNVGLSDANLSKLELCAKIKEQVADFVYLEAPIGEDPDKRDYIVSNEKIEKTGFKPHYSLDMGIRELIKGYRIISNSKYSNV
jgi:nucleoside-diphosphate-sugar epimerase